MAARKRTPEESAASFWQKVNKKGPEECWEWTGCRLVGWHGQLRVNNKGWLAHRFSWFLHNGTIPEGLFVCHKCDNPICVNPSHLFLGTNTDNMRDCVSKGRNCWPAKLPDYKPWSRLTQEQVDDIRFSYAPGIKTMKELATEFGVTRQNIRSILREQTWKTSR